MDVNSQFWPECDSGGIRVLGDRKIGCDGGLNQMNFEGGFSIPPERLNPMRGNWMPITPDKQIQRSNQGNQFPAEEWQQLTGMYGAIIQEPATNFSGGPQNFNPMEAVQNAGCYGDLAERSSRVHSNIAGSYAQAINMDRPSWDGSFSLANLMAMRNAALRTQTNRTYRGIPIGNAPRIPDLHSQVDTSWRRPYAGTMPLATVDQWSTSNQMGACNNISQIPQHGFPVPYRSNNYNLNLPPRAETDATTISNSVGISTLPQNESDKFGGSQFSAMFNFLTDESSSKKNDQDNFVPLVGNEEVRHPCNELQNIVDSSSTVISTPFKENTDSEKASDQYIDLNKTPQLKAPKRRKIRPKVVIEGKPKRVPKSAGQSSKENQTAKRKYVRKTGLKESGSQQAVTINSPTRANPENTDSKENTTGKRKYVRRKGVTESATQQADIRHSNTDPNARRATKSCRRGLNFDLEKSSDDDQGKISGQEEVRESTRPSNLNLDSRETELGAGTSSLCETRSDGQISQQGRTTGTSNFTPSMANMLNNYISLLGRQAKGAPQASMIGRHIENSNISSIDGNADQWLRKSQLGYTPRQQNIYTEGIGQIVYQTKKSEENTETTRQPMSQNRPYQVLNTFSNFIGARGSKREFQQMLEQGECYRNSSNFGTGLSETHKRKRFENGLLTRVYGMPLIRAVDDASREDSTKTINGVGINCFKSQINQEILTSYFDNCKSPRKLSSGVDFNGSMDPHCKAAGPNLPQQQAPELHSYTDRMGETRRVTMVQNLASPTTCESHNPHPPSTPRKASAKGKGQVKRTYHTTEQANLQAQDTLNKQLSIQSKGLTGWKQNPIQIDEIINRLKGLSLRESDHILLGQEQKALVLYKGNGAIVVQDIKKSKPRPKVDLDPETNRIWKLLMGNEGSEGIEGTDKEKWWEGEREVFRGRANSFIARMHLVQGDRRFSPWKGSVVDSVIGVFLTQNVSDHLSSSAFMCLAAQFPLNSTSNESYVSNGKSILVEEPEDCIVNLENVSCLPVYNPSSITPQELRDQRRDCEASGTERTSFTEAQSQSIEEEIISSQGSYDSSIVQDNEGISSSSGSNSEADDPINGSNYKMSHGSSSTNFQEMEKTIMFQECCSRVNGSSIFDEKSNYQNKQLERMECGMPRSRLKRDNLKSSAFTYPITSQDQMRVPAAPSKNCVSHMNPEFRAQEYIGIFCEESASPLSSTSSEFIKAKDANCTNNLMAENASENNIQHNRLLRSQEMTVGPFELSSRHSVQHDSISLTEPHTGHAKTLQHNYPSGRNNSFQTENISIAEPLKHAEGLANWKNDSMHNIPNVSKQMENASDIEECISVMTKQSNAENKSVKPKPKPKKQVHFSSKADNEMNTKAKKVKAENEGKKTFDWDSLRRQVQANGRKERSKDAMDTMDYEAMRCAKVKEISDAIKERGMNNMLAERIQDFLNRLVREHGGIDLEWLRDVPPDKAKEYLLSIRGLGLKSVECVRLLTLQQLAFPVDTNVGRIAVRLGWVPLQPLPESLQLHLLEMYPILESVQKYIWPRLCKLDQRTLYELHYQMITFGKVFCTKNKPNCNACPMKGECRHFASAFASARLALPSPEEKSIVTSTFPTAQAENPTAVINPMLLLKEAGQGIGKCDPIIEEPATPEQERAEISETDIEDMFDEDPNEIPTIKLNIETFTENLQKYMKDNMDLQEGDMSKALVALNTDAAAIPTPKLKNVSRLRTEHQVYELPDSHPLLKGMERREPDDPSPYLLAIWTPGETADSVQTPEIRCSLDTGKLCNDDTCFSCNSMRESNSQTVRGTILVPCRTAMRGSFPLNGTYFQVNEMFADHDSSVNPIDVPRAWIWNLPRRTVYFGTSVSTIFKGLSTEGIQYCFWRGFVCVRGFDHKTRAPRPLSRRLHAPHRMFYLFVSIKYSHQVAIKIEAMQS